MPKIYGIKVTKSEFKILKFILISEEQAGWKPSKLDLLHLIRRGRQSKNELMQEMKDFDSAMDKIYQINKY